MSPKLRRILLWVFLATLMSGLVWAALDPYGTANKIAAEAGDNAADTHMASINSIKSKEQATIDWKQEQALKKRINQADADYKTRLQKAQSDIASTGKVADATRNAGMASAGRFQTACEAYAAFWDKNNGPTRAKLSRDVGASRIKSADMAFNDISSEKVDAYNAQQEALRKSQKEYLADAKGDLSPQDRAAIKADLTPKLQALGSNVATLVQQIISLISQVQSQAGGGLSVGAVAGCAAKIATSDKPADGIGALFAPLQALLSLVKSMGTNIQGMASDISAL